MWTEIKENYRGAWRFTVALPGLVAIPIAAELVQHAIEAGTGMFESMAGMEAAGDHPARMGWGMVKVLALALMGLWVPRFLAFNGDRARTLHPGGEVLRAYSLVLLFTLALGALQHFVGPALAAALPKGQRGAAAGALFALMVVVDLLLICWMAAAALGDRRVTVARSARLMMGSFWWSLAFLIIMTLPLMVVHYALNFGAVGQPAGVTWAILIVDSLLVGYLGALLAATRYLIYRRATERAAMERLA